MKALLAALLTLTACGQPPAEDCEWKSFTWQLGTTGVRLNWTGESLRFVDDGEETWSVPASTCREAADLACSEVKAFDPTAYCPF